MKNISIVYTITETDHWRSKEGINIKSNIADDKLLDCQIASSLVNELKEKAALLDADKLLLGFAEAQKRGIQDNLEALNDFELTAKNQADSIHQKLLNLEEETEIKYNELFENFSTITDRFNKKILTTEEKLTTQLNKLKLIEEKINSINTYSFDKISESLKSILSLVDKDPELVKIVFKTKLS